MTTVELKYQCLYWANQHFKYVQLLDSNNYQHDDYSAYDHLIAASNKKCSIHSFEDLKSEVNQNKWLFGFFSYELKNQIEDLFSNHPDNVGFDEIGFFEPEVLMAIKNGSLHFLKGDSKVLSKEIKACKPVFEGLQSIKMESRFLKANYLDTIESIKEDIREGTYYEINLCNEFYIEERKIDPFSVFYHRNHLNPNPFAAFLKWDNLYCLCCSPERFIARRGNTLIAQPIKGTIKRSINANENESLKNQLKNSLKDRAENVMIVDLLRNDLSKSCIPGTVEVPELFGVYSFPNLHHLISTVLGELKDEVHFIDAIKNAFPMGSMTGAPKIKVMECIEKYEKVKRGLYSGSIGYIQPDGNFDFNVVIRSFMYNSESYYLNYQSGGAITIDSDPESEWQEVRLKAKNILK